MSRTLDLAYHFPATPETVYSLYADPEFLGVRLRSTTDAGSSELTSHEVTENSVDFVVTTSMPRSSLPKPVKGFVRGEPKITRDEHWIRTDDDFTGNARVTFMGPGKIIGSMTLRPDGEGSVLAVHFDIDVPLPMSVTTWRRPSNSKSPRL